MKDLVEEVDAYLLEKGIEPNGRFNYESPNPRFSKGVVLTASPDREKINAVIGELNDIHCFRKREFFAKPVHYHEGQLPGFPLELTQSYLLVRDSESVWIGFEARAGYSAETIKKERAEGIEDALRKGAEERRIAEKSSGTIKHTRLRYKA